MLAELIRANQPCVVLTGAGVSTESGIPDFRSASGIWAQYDPYEVASIDGFHRDPERVWEFYAHRLDVLADAAPNPAHLALAELESRGLVQAVITQNVDRLHNAAGSRDVIEVHGSIATAVCLGCGRREEQVRRAAAAPALRRLRRRAQAWRRHVRRAAPGRRRSSARPRSRRTRSSCSSSAPRSRCGRSPGCPTRRWCTAASSRS